ncbi:DUF4259 domain-containing protein [Arthrobacter sp. TMT4-20]
MGAWGTGIFSNDTSRDVRDDFARHLGNGLSLDQAVEKILDEYCSNDRLDPDNNDVWLGLAAAQHASGHVTSDVINTALAIVESPLEYDRWSPEDANKRRSALHQLRQTLRSEPRPPKRFRKKVLQTTERTPGDHELYSDGSSRLLLRVVGVTKDTKGEYPLYTVLDWNGDEDQLDRAEKLNPLPVKDDFMGWEYFKVCVPHPLPKDTNLTLLGSKSRYQDPRFASWGFDSMDWPNLVPYVKGDAARVPPTI